MGAQGLAKPGVAYLDASAVVKLLVEEPETSALVTFLEFCPVRLSSQLLRVELICVCRRRGTPINEALALLAGISLLPVTPQTIEAAGQPFNPAQRALDAIHLATASQLIGNIFAEPSLGAFVTYDDNQRRAAKHLGWEVYSPSEESLEAENSPQP